MHLSVPAVASVEPSGEMATARMAPRWPRSVANSWPRPSQKNANSANRIMRTDEVAINRVRVPKEVVSTEGLQAARGEARCEREAASGSEIQIDDLAAGARGDCRPDHRRHGVLNAAHRAVAEKE